MPKVWLIHLAPAPLPRVAEARATMAQHCTVFPVEPGGWCFFDCVAQQFRRGSDPIEFDRLAVAAPALEELIRRRSAFEDRIPQASRHKKEHSWSMRMRRPKNLDGGIGSAKSL